MAKIKFKSDKAGSFYKKDTFELVDADFVSPGSHNTKVFIKLLSPRDANITALTLSINKKVINVVVPAGKLVTAGPYPFLVGENLVSFDGSSDTPEAAHELEINPQLLK